MKTRLFETGVAVRNLGQAGVPQDLPGVEVERDHFAPPAASVACVKPGWPIVDRTARPGRYTSGMGGVKDRYAVSRCGSYRLVSRSRREHRLEGALGSRNRFEGRRWWRPEAHGNPRPMEVRTIASNGAAHDVRVLVASGVSTLFANPGTTERASWRRPRRRLRRMAGVVLGRTQAGAKTSAAKSTSRSLTPLARTCSRAEFSSWRRIE